MTMSSKQITVKCPKCEATNVVTLQQVADQSEIKCEGCEVIINLVDDNESTKEVIKDINHALDKLAQKIDIEIKI